MSKNLEGDPDFNRDCHTFSNSRLDRRAFLGSGAAAAAVMGASLIASSRANAIDLAPPDKQPEKLPTFEAAPKKVRWAIVGLGDLALTQILPAFAVSRLSAPIALVSGHADKAKKVAENYSIDPNNIYSYENFDSIKDNLDIDIVYIVLPNSMHAEYTIRALKAGKHVLCEKPMTRNIAEAEAMIATAKEFKRKLMIAYRLRYEPHNQKMIELARNKTYGPIKLITAENVQDVQAPNIRLSKKLAGGPLGDVGIYCLNACRYLTNEDPIEVNAMVTKPLDDLRFAEVEDRIIFQLRFPSGVLANCTAGFSTGTYRRYMAYAQKGSFGLDPAFSYSGLKGIVDTAESRQTLKIEQANQFAAEMDHFSSCVIDDTEPTTPGEEGLKDVKIMERIMQSAQEGKRLSVSV